MSSKYVLTDSNMLHRKALSLNEDFREESPELSAKPFTASEAWLHRFRSRFGLKNVKTTGELCLMMKLPPHFQQSRSCFRVWYYPRFQASTGGLGTYPAGQGDYSSQFCLGTWMYRRLILL